MLTPVYSSRRQRSLAALPGDLFRSRELLLDLVRKDVRVRYRYAALGIVWAVLEPLALMAVLAFVFSFVLGERGLLPAGADAPPYAVFLLSGLLFWQFTAVSLNNAAQSILDNRSLVQKVAFTREILPIAAMGYPLINLGIGFAILLVLHLATGGGLGVSLLALPLVFAVQCGLTLGVGLIAAWANALYRDVGYMLSVALMLGFYASPVLYPVSLVASSGALPPWAVSCYQLNPMAGIIESYRVILFEGAYPTAEMLGWPACLAFTTLVAGAVTFRHAAPTLSDHL